jgi:multiple sugar transport system substrate-binding protein
MRPSAREGWRLTPRAPKEGKMRRWGWLGVIAGIWAAGCSDEVPNQGGDAGAPIDPVTPVTIAFLQHSNPTYDVANGAAFRAYEKAHSNVTIKTTTIEYQSLTATLLANLKNDRLEADLLQVPGNWICSFSANVADVPADVITLGAAQNTFFDAPLAGATCNGTLKALPIEYNLEYGGVVLNVDKYHARFPGKTPGWIDWKAFLADASGLAEFDTDGTPRANGLDIDPNWPGAAVYIFLSQILQRGGHYWAPDKQTFDLNTPEARDTLTDITNWMIKDKVMSLSLVPNRTDTFVVTRLVQGATGYGWNDPNRPLSAMGYLGSWGLAVVRHTLPPERQQENFDYFPLPPMVGTQHRFITYGGWVFAVPKTSKNQRLAWDIARSLALDATAMKQWSATTYALPALRANGSAEAAANDPLLAKVQPLLERGEFIGYMPAGALQDMEGAILSNIFHVVRGTKTVEKALADIQQTTNESFALNR